MAISIYDSVDHSEFGTGVVEDILGQVARVNFFGEKIDVNIEELTVKKFYEPPVKTKDNNLGLKSEKNQFRRSFEAINLGVVPPDPEQLIKLAIGGDFAVRQIQDWLEDYYKTGMCRVVFGYYGSGKSHFLNMVKCVALQSGWVVSYLEFDPKEADPAKPHLVYRNLMSTLEFPARDDGSITEGFFGFVKEVRDNWYSKSIRSLKLFQKSPWFLHGFEVLIRHAHTEDSEYHAGCNWLAGDYKSYDTINRMGKNKGYRFKVPRMPVTKDTADIYAFHLCVIGELCRALGYKGFMIVLDEAEHVRSYNVKRKERANNFFDILSRCAHIPSDLDPPYPNEHRIVVPEYWKNGPFYSLFVGLTEGDTFSDPSLTLQEACVFTHTQNDCIFLQPPQPEEYREWCVRFFQEFYRHYPTEMVILKKEENINKIAEILFEMFQRQNNSEVILRNWIKLAGLVPCLLFSKHASNVEHVISIIRNVASEYIFEKLPWED